MMKQYLIHLCILYCFHLSAQEMKTPYSDWVKSEFPVTHALVTDMITTQYGKEEIQQNVYMIELQCIAFNNVLVFMNSDQADWVILEKSLIHGCTYTGADRALKDWWEWPETDWIKVEYEFKLLVDKATKSEGG